MEWPFQLEFTRVKPMLPKWGIDPNEYSSGTLYKAADLALEGHVHNALHDVRSMAQAVAMFEGVEEMTAAQENYRSKTRQST